MNKSNVRDEICISRHPLLIEKTIIIDGLTRAGKFLLGKLVSNFEQVEYFQYQSLIEHIPLLNFMKLASQENLENYFRIVLNQYVYERLIGRSLNDRPESSSILNSTEYSEYRARKQRPDGMEAVNLGIHESRIPSFLVHECLPHIEFFHLAIPQMFFINIQRHPLDLSYSWYQRGWGTRLGTDNLAFIPTFLHNDKPYPWFAKNWVEEWIALDNRPMDRIIRSLAELFRLEREAYQSFSHKSQVHLLCYESLFERPNEEIERLGKFLGRRPFSNMSEILDREGCPNPTLPQDRQKRIEKVKKIASEKYYGIAVDVCREYDELWQINGIEY